MAKSKGKSKGPDFKELLLKKGEYIALGVAAVGLAVLLLWGVTAGAGAADPKAITTDLSGKARQIQTAINAPSPVEPDPVPLLKEGNKTFTYSPINTQDFTIAGRYFDPTGRPDTKRENPKLVPLGDFQLDLVRGAMPGYDLLFLNGGQDAQIAMKVVSKLDAANSEKVKEALEKIAKKGQKGRNAARNLVNRMQPGGPMGPMGPGGPMGPMGPGGPGGPGAPGMGIGMGMGSGYDASAKREDTKIVYRPLDQLDNAIANKEVPALTVIPLRLAVINAIIPFKQQVAEVARAMRFKDPREALPYVRYDGFEVKRRITRVLPNGEVQPVQEWAEYPYEDKYVELIHSRKVGDYFEGSDPKNEQGPYLPYFYRYEDALAMPLPELVPELGSYPRIKLRPITDTIAKLREAATPKVDPSDLAARLQKKGSRRDFFNIGADTGASQIPGTGMYGMGPGMPRKGGDKIDPKNMGGVLDNQAGIEIDNLLLRFVDCDIMPGFTYEYQFRLRLVNPNFDQPKAVSNPADAKVQVVTGPWNQLPQSLTVPSESFLYALDPAAYRAEIEAAYGKDQKYLRAKLQANSDQAVVEAVTWLEQVRTDNSNQREPVGGWVVADMPVGRGEYLGKKTFVKLPLWSSEANQYVLRDVPATAVKKDKEQPKGWLVDFSTRSVLVDFEGGKVSTRLKSGKNLPTEDAGTEMLILGTNGKLQVRRSTEDASDPVRKELTDIWNKWVKAVESRPTTTSGTGTDNMFERKQP